MQGIAETNFPSIDNQNGIMLSLTDVFNKNWEFRYRFWINNTSRMYLIEGTQELQQQFRLTVGDVLMFAKDPSDIIYICGRKGTDDDVGRKPQGKRLSSSSGSIGGNNPKPSKYRGVTTYTNQIERNGMRSKRLAAHAAASTGYLSLHQGSGYYNRISQPSIPHRMFSNEADNEGLIGHDERGNVYSGRQLEANIEQKNQEADAAQEAQHLYTYWNGLSLPARRDGVFRAAPPDAIDAGQGNRVQSQYGFWTAIVTLQGEQYQAFFEGKRAAVAALEAALQYDEQY